MSCHDPTYTYLPLAHGNIRLLKLLPDPNELAPVQCRLFDYPLQGACKSSHLYEALSYVWGDQSEAIPIFIGKHRFNVTENLHAALLYLRDCCIERVIWVDAVCINQKNDEEKGEQIQLMASIYSSAQSVVVWLGEEADDSDQALQAIVRAGNNKELNFEDDVIVQQAVTKLLQRQWFRRIWVLQEVAAARHIRFACGSFEIDGYAFCLGVDSLHSLYDSCIGLQSLIRSVTYLVRGAIFRLSHSSSGSVPEGICSLGELLDMYHTHEATKRHDKIYALLGMSSSNPASVSLVPNYRKPWENVMQNMGRFVVSKEMRVKTRPDTEAIMFEGTSDVLGKILSTKSNTGWGDRQVLKVHWRQTITKTDVERYHIGFWTIQESAKPVHEGDIVCLLKGAAGASIIRPQQDFGVIIVISANLPSYVQSGPETLTDTSIRELVLVWDWSSSAERMEQLQTWMQSVGWTTTGDKEDSKFFLKRASRYWNNGLVLSDVENYAAAMTLFEKAIMNYEMAFRDIDLKSIEFGPTNDPVLLYLDDEHSQYFKHKFNGWTPFLSAVKEGHQKIASHLLLTGVADVNDRDENGQPLITWAAGKGEVEILKKLIRDGAHVNITSGNHGTRTALQAAAKGGHLRAVKWLLRANADVDKSGADYNGRTALQAAAEGGHLFVVERLLEAEANVNASPAVFGGRTALQGAAGCGHMSVVERLIRAQANVNARAAAVNGRTALQAAAEGGHLLVVERLLEAKADINAMASRRKGKMALQAAKDGGHLAVVECLLLAGAKQ